MLLKQKWQVVVAGFVILLAQLSGRSQSDTVRKMLLDASDSSFEEIKVAGEWVRGKEIGNDEFKPCDAPKIKKQNRETRKSDKCHGSGNPNRLPPERVVIIGWDPVNFFLAVKVPGDSNVYLLYVPDSALRIKSGDASLLHRDRVDEFKSSSPQEVIIFRDIPERIEGIAFVEDFSGLLLSTEKPPPVRGTRPDTVIHPGDKHWPTRFPPQRATVKKPMTLPKKQ